MGEMISTCPLFFAPILKILFSSMFDNGIFPDNWTECIVILISKSGNLSDPNNYLPIVLVSILSKLCTSILSERFLSWSEKEEKLIINKFGFRPGRSTIDAVFSFHGIVRHLLQNRKLYCAFVDFRKAFDKLNRRVLLY